MSCPSGAVSSIGTPRSARMAVGARRADVEEPAHARRGRGLRQVPRRVDAAGLELAPGPPVAHLRGRVVDRIHPPDGPGAGVGIGQVAVDDLDPQRLRGSGSLVRAAPGPGPARPTRRAARRCGCPGGPPAPVTRHRAPLGIETPVRSETLASSSTPRRCIVRRSHPIVKDLCPDSPRPGTGVRPSPEKIDRKVRVSHVPLSVCQIDRAGGLDRAGVGASVGRGDSDSGSNTRNHHAGRNHRSRSARADEEPDPQAGGRDRRPGRVGHPARRSSTSSSSTGRSPPWRRRAARSGCWTAEGSLKLQHQLEFRLTGLMDGRARTQPHDALLGCMIQASQPQIIPPGRDDRGGAQRRQPDRLRADHRPADRSTSRSSAWSRS